VGPLLKKPLCGFFNSGPTGRCLRTFRLDEKAGVLCEFISSETRNKANIARQGYEIFASAKILLAESECKYNRNSGFFDYWSTKKCLRTFRLDEKAGALCEFISSETRNKANIARQGYEIFASAKILLAESKWAAIKICRYSYECYIYDKIF